MPYISLIQKASVKCRNTRFMLFKQIIQKKSPIKILDIGGTQKYWEEMNFLYQKNIEITLLNIWEVPVTYPCFKSIVADARDLSMFKDNEFDFVFSNSVIEHVGTFEDQKRFADEVKRVGKNYYVQTPNRYFPIEPHVIFPFFQFFPLSIKAFMVNKFNMGWFKRIDDYASAKKVIGEIRLLTKSELFNLFEECELYKEKYMGMTKSFVVYKTYNGVSDQLKASEISPLVEAAV